jgi:hypothetical protein
VYILGGANGTVNLNTVRYAKINTDGTLGAWTTSPMTFATARISLAATALNGYMYISGGESTAGTAVGDLQYAPINADGSIGAWRSSNNITTVSGGPTAYTNHSMVAYGGRMFIMGGRNATPATLATVYATGLNAPSLSASYSKLVNLGSLNTLNSISTNGILPPGQSNILFKVAGNDGVFGAWRLSSSLVAAPLTNVQYVMYKVMLNDSGASSVSADASRSTINDITLDYTFIPMLTTENRLRQNKYFDANGLVQPLQTQ